jgi:hypothetical protein
MSLDRLDLLEMLIKRTEIMVQENIGWRMEIFSSGSGLTIKEQTEIYLSCNQMALASQLQKIIRFDKSISSEKKLEVLKIKNMTESLMF